MLLDLELVTSAYLGFLLLFNISKLNTTCHTGSLGRECGKMHVKSLAHNLAYSMCSINVTYY